MSVYLLKKVNVLEIIWRGLEEGVLCKDLYIIVFKVTSSFQGITLVRMRILLIVGAGE